MFHILHVDDCLDDRVIIGRHLQRREDELTIEGFGSVAEALETLKQRSYDCILSDFQMPEADGLDFLRALRQGGDRTPFIMLTGQGNEEIAALALREGADDYYTKEEGLAHYDRLVNAIRKLISANRNLDASHELEASYTALFESIDVGVAVYEAVGDGEDFVFKNVNGAVERLENYTKEELIGRSVKELFPNVEEYGLFDVFRQVFRSGRPTRHPISLYSDGRIEGWRENYVYKLPGGEIVSVYRDITERKKRALQQEAVYRISELAHTVDDQEELFSSIHGIVRELMPARNLFIALLNPGTGKLEFPYFVDEQDPRPKPVDTNTGLAAWVFSNNRPLLIKPETLAEVTEELDIELLGTPSGDWLGVPLTTGGMTIGVLAVQSYRENIRYGEEDLKVLTFVSLQIASAIERHRTEKELRRNEWLFKQVSEICADFSYLSEIPLHGPPTAQVLGGAFEEVTGYSRHDMSTIDSWLALIHPEDKDYFMRTVAEHSRTGEPVTMEYRMVTKDGRVRWVREHTHPLWVEKEGRITLVVGAVEDVTDDKIAEHELLESRDKLKRQSQQLELANQELETFAYTVSHDLKAPLRRINGWLSLLEGDFREKLSDEGVKMLDKLSDTSDQMKELIDSLLDLSKITSGELSRDEVDLSLMVNNAIKDLAAEESDRRLETAIREGVTVRGDMRLLRAVVRNLVDNAWKFTRKKESTRIEFFLEEREGRTVYCLRDNGIGFALARAEKLFQPFTRLHGSEEYAGTGIGLATVRRIIHRHGGRVWAEAVEGEGACFRFTLD